MSGSGRVVSIDALALADPDRHLADLRSVDCSDFWNALTTARDAASENGETERAHALDALAGASSLILRAGEPLQPFAPLMEMAFGSSARPEKYNGPQAGIFGDFATVVVQPALRARLADLAWLYAKRSDCARVAIEAYLDCVRLLVRRRAGMRGKVREASSMRSLDLLRRACVIERQLGWIGPGPTDLGLLAKTVRDQARRRGDGFGYARAAELALEFQLVKPLLLGRGAEKLARAIAGTGTEHVEIDLLEHAVAAYRRADRRADADRALSALAECHVRKADHVAKLPFMEVHWLESAIAILRQFKGTHERRAELQGRLIRAQGRIGEFLPAVRERFDGKELIELTQGRFQGLDMVDALLLFSQLEESPPPSRLFNEAKESFSRTPFANLFAPRVYDPKFKLASRLPAVDFAGQPDEANLRFKIIQHEEARRAIAVAVEIEPARIQIVLDHQPDQRVLTRLAALSPLVPRGHEMLFGRGFAHFFNADFVEAAHLLVLQIEPLLRHVLISADIDITRFKSDQTQSSATLTVLLDPAKEYRGPLDALLGEEAIFEIENLFDLEAGPALRHRLAHGLLNQWSLVGADAIYACWFLFRLCIAPLGLHGDELRTRLIS